MNLQSFLTELSNREIHVWADGDRLRCKAPAGVLTPTLREQLMARKNEILAFLRTAERAAAQPRAIVPLQASGTREPIYAVAGHNGDVFTFRALAQQLGPDQPFFGLEPPGLDGTSEPLQRVEDIAAYFADQIQAFQPEGSYVIAGYCAGGTIAFELARQLRQRGASIRFLALFAAPYPTYCRFSSQLGEAIAEQAQSLGKHLRALLKLSFAQQRSYIGELLRNRKARHETKQAAMKDPVLQRRARVQSMTASAVAHYTPGIYDGPVSLFLPSRQWMHSRAEPLRWRAVAPNAEQYFGRDGCTADILLLEPDAPVVAALFRECQEQISLESAPPAPTV